MTKELGLKQVSLIAGVCIAFMLAGCSGGGSSSSSTSTSGSTGTTVTVPGVPTSVSATAGDGEAVITFSAPSSNGGATITSYTATCSISGGTSATASASSSPITVTGLTNGSTYSCSVTATNSAGTSSASTAVSVTPVAATTSTSDCDQLTAIGEEITCRTNNFLATLTSTQKSSVQNDFTQTNATNYWSNLPVSFSSRLGIQLGDMTTAQQTAAEEVLYAALSDQGGTTMDDIRIADGYLGNYQNGYGEDLYAVSVLGTPSTTAPWLLVFSGHHYTFVIAIDGDYVSMTPNFVAVEPVSFTYNGTAYQPMARHRTALLAMLNGLSSSEKTGAQLAQAYGDVLVGPQKDGNYPSTRDGLAVSGLTDAQKALVAAAIKVYSDDQEGGDLSAAYTTDAALNDTYIAWSSYSDLSTRGSYFRIDGPRVWIEFSVQSGVIFSANHYHTIWRDKEMDYGGNFSF